MKVPFQCCGPSHLPNIVASNLAFDVTKDAIGMHTGSMTQAQSFDLFQNQCFQNAGSARQQAARGTYDPAYLNYTMGKLMIRKLRDRGCIGCHKGPMFSDFQPHVLGVVDHPSVTEPDTGIEGRNAYRTPSLRNVSLTEPYMHTGRVPELVAAVGFYMRADSVPLNPRVRLDQLDPLLEGIAITTQTGLFDLVDFLRALEGTFDKTIPARVPSGLKPGGR